MNWVEFIVHTTTSGADSVSSVLIDLGATGTMTEDRADIPDPAKPNGIWEIIDPKLLESMPEDVLVHAWFEDDDQLGTKYNSLLNHLKSVREKNPGYGALTVETKSIGDEDWGESWKRFYHPLRAGNHLVIKPSWETYDAKPGDKIIQLDPGMAFGSGYHDTTVLCLSMLEKNIRPGDKVIDVGTGSGILAIGAAMCGAKDVLAIDIDPYAIQTAAQNIEINGVGNTVRIQQGDLLDHVEESCRICVANIIADVIIGFAKPLMKHIQPGGLFICSGIVAEREAEVLSALESAGYQVIEIRRTEEWVAICSGRSE